MALLKEYDIKKGQRILITDIAGVLNTSLSVHNVTSFDTEAVAQVRRIVEKTGCEVILSPIEVCDSISTCAIANLLGAVMETEVYTMVGIEHVLKILGLSEPESYCVLRYFDGPEREWMATFGNRYVHCGSAIENQKEFRPIAPRRVEFKAGLTKEKADEAIAMLSWNVAKEEIPIKVNQAILEIGANFLWEKRNTLNEH